MTSVHSMTSLSFPSMLILLTSILVESEGFPSMVRSFVLNSTLIRCSISNSVFYLNAISATSGPIGVVRSSLPDATKDLADLEDDYTPLL